MTLRWYPALLWWRGPLGSGRSGYWHVQLLDFRDLGGHGKTRDEALNDAQQALQERVNGVADHQELPHPSHRLVAEAKLVATEAHGLELIKVETRLEPDFKPPEPEEEKKSNDSKHQGYKKKHRSRR
jgi:predicted RNase H-like HicB family nuclease